LAQGRAVTAPFPNFPPARVNGLILLLCAMALASPLVEPVPGGSTHLFWLARAAGVALAVAAVVWVRFQRVALAGVALFLVVAPSILQMHYRAWSAPHTFCHDSVVQFEEAIRMVRRKENPYVRDFSGTALVRWQGWKDNPAIHHFVYPPFLLLVSLPVEALCRGFYDQRLVLLLFFLALLALLWRLFRDHPHRIGILALIALNPWFGPFIVEGRNDVAMVFWVVAAWGAYETGHGRWGHFLLGLAIATKTLLLPIIPFVMMAHRREWPVCIAILVAPLLLTSLPFLVADGPAFVDDLFGAPSGMGDHPFEIRGWGGLGFANLALATGWAASPQARFPFWIFQAAAYGSCLFFGLRSLWKNPVLSHALGWSAGAVFVILFFGRFIHDNYIGSLLSIAVLAQLSTGATRDRSGDLPPPAR
jgi:hypothetical protein